MKVKKVKRNNRKKSKSSKRTNLLRQNSLSSSRTSLNCFGSLEGLNKLFGSINFGLTYERSQSMIDLPRSMDMKSDKNRDHDQFKILEKKRFMITYGDEDDDEIDDDKKNDDNDDNNDKDENNDKDGNNDKDDDDDDDDDTGETKNDETYSKNAYRRRSTENNGTNDKGRKGYTEQSERETKVREKLETAV